MNKPKLYLETSVWNFLFADDAPEKKLSTKRFFAEAEAGSFQIFISETVMEEISHAPRDKRERLYSVIKQYSPILLEETEDVLQLAWMWQTAF